MTPRARIAIIVGAVVALVVAFVVARGSSDTDNKDSTTTSAASASAPSDTTTAAEDPARTTTTAPAPAPAVPVVTVVGGQPQGGVKKLSFTKGDTIRFVVTSDAGGEVHFHGYDIAKDLPEGGGRVAYSVPATIEGRFEVELEKTGTQIAEVEVDPS